MHESAIRAFPADIEVDPVATVDDVVSCLASGEIISTSTEQSVLV
jgi:hypothetical protein